MVEQGTHKPLVVGSNPSLATKAPRERGLFYACGMINPAETVFDFSPGGWL